MGRLSWPQWAILFSNCCVLYCCHCCIFRPSLRLISSEHFELTRFIMINHHDHNVMTNSIVGDIKNFSYCFSVFPCVFQLTLSRIWLLFSVNTQKFPKGRRSVCGHISLGFCRRGNPMEVIDDCTVFFFGILPRTLRQTVPPPKKTVVRKFLDSSVEFEYYTPALSWVWVQRLFLHKLYSWRTSVVLNSTHCNQGRSCSLSSKRSRSLTVRGIWEWHGQQVLAGGPRATCPALLK